MDDLLGHHLGDLVGRDNLHALLARLTVNADAELHLVVTHLEDGLAGGGHGAGGQGHAHAAAIAVGLAGQVGALLQVVAGFGRRADDLLDEDRGPDAAPAGSVEAVLHGHVVIDEDVLDGDALGMGQIGGHLEIEYVAGVVLDQEQHARAAVDGLGRLVHLVGRGRGEDRAGAGRVEHTHADEAAVHRLVAAAAAGDDGHLAGHRGVGAVDVVRVEVDFQQVRMGRGHTLKLLFHDIRNGIDEFFHGYSFAIRAGGSSPRLAGSFAPELRRTREQTSRARSTAGRR